MTSRVAVSGGEEVGGELLRAVRSVRDASGADLDYRVLDHRSLPLEEIVAKNGQTAPRSRVPSPRSRRRENALAERGAAA